LKKVGKYLIYTDFGSVIEESLKNFEGEFDEFFVLVLEFLGIIIIFKELSNEFRIGEE